MDRRSPVCRSVSLSVCLSLSWALQKSPIRSRCRLGYGLGWDSGTMYESGSRSLYAKEQFWGQKGAGLRHVQTCSVVHTVTATKQGATPVLRCTIWGAPDEYDWTVRVQQRCSLMSNNFDHLFAFVVIKTGNNINVTGTKTVLTTKAMDETV